MFFFEGEHRHLIGGDIHVIQEISSLLNQLNAIHLTHFVVDDHQGDYVHLVLSVHLLDCSQDQCTAVVEAYVVVELQLIK